MSQAPWFKFFAADYMSSPFVQALDPEQELWYLRLIIASAISEPRGCLPLAIGKLWRLAKAPSLEHFERNAGAILAKFEKDEAAGVYVVAKVANQLIGNAELSQKRSEAGKKGAVAKWQKPSGLPSQSMANASDDTCQTMADSDSDSEVKIPQGDLYFSVSSSRSCADELLKRLNLPATSGNVQAVAAAIDAVIAQHGWPLPQVGDWLMVRAKDHMSHGLSVDRFWFEDAKYNGSGLGLSKAEHRLAKNRQVIVDELFGNAKQRGGGVCEKHPESGLTTTGGCWGCYEERCATEQEIA